MDLLKTTFDDIKNNLTLEEQKRIAQLIEKNVETKKNKFDKIEKEKIILSTNIGDEIYFLYKNKKFSGELLRKNNNSFVVSFLEDGVIKEERRDYKFFLEKM